MATSPIVANEPQPPQPPQPPGTTLAEPPGTRLFIPQSDGTQREFALIAYNIFPEKLDDFKKTFFSQNVREFFANQKTQHAHSWLIGNLFLVLGTPEINVPWLDKVKDISQVTAAPLHIDELGIFP